MSTASPQLQHATLVCSATFASNLLAEVRQLFQAQQTPWIPLLSIGGYHNQDLPMSGDLQATPSLQNSPYLWHTLHNAPTALGRVCLLQSAVKPNTPPLYHNASHALHYHTHCIALGEAYYLVLETCTAAPLHITLSATEVASTQTSLPLLDTQLDILTPSQLHVVLAKVLAQRPLAHQESQWQQVSQQLQQFQQRWQTLWEQFQQNYTGEWSYQAALNQFREQLIPLVRTASKTLPSANRQYIEQQLQYIATQFNFFPPAPRRVNRAVLQQARRRKQFQVDSLQHVPQFERPIFIVSTPRAGSTLLFETLSRFPKLWSTAEENHALLEDIAGLHPRDQQFASNRLTATEATSSVRSSLLKAFTSKLQDREQQYYLDLTEDSRPHSVRFLEKTPKNALRIPFIKALFPDALFVYLHRDFHSNVSSLIDGWRSQRFIAYRDLPNFANRHWSFLLTPNWQSMTERSIAEIAAYQWQTSNQIIQQDLAALPNTDWFSIDYADLISQPEQVVQQFADFAGLAWDEEIQARCAGGLPVSRLTLSSPQQNKWQKHRKCLDSMETGHTIC